MKSSRKLLVVTLSTIAICAPALAQVTYTDAEVAYVAAKWLEADFAREDALCDKRSYRKQLDANRATFEQTHPAYVTALGLQAPRPEVVEVSNRKLDQFAKLYERMMPMLAMMPREKLCNDIISDRPVSNFDKKLTATRDMLARDVPPAPEEPLTSLAPGDVDPIVAAVLQHADVAMYLHPDAPGRVPVRVALAAPYDRGPVQLSLYGAPVKLAGNGDRGAVQLTLKPHGDRVKVEVKYDPEGIFGSVDLERVEGTWRATAAKIYE